MMLATFTACEKEALQSTFESNEGKSIRILLNAQGDDVTRAISRSEGNDTYGENTIATADVFFYTANGTLLYDVAKENVTLSAPDDNGVVTATVPMPADKNIDLTQASTVYVMGNCKATDTQVRDAKSSEDNLRALTFTTDLATVPTAETTFAMDGTGTITVKENEISGIVELVRAAAKITLTVNIPSSLESDGITYYPQISGVTVTFHQGVKTFGNSSEIFNVEREQRQASAATDNGMTPVTFDPFYSYPITWETGGDNEPYFSLHVPWGVKEGESVKSYSIYHYRVPINKTHFDKDENGKVLTTLSLNRNHWYQIDLTVGVLGTPEASDLVDIEGYYEVKPWGNLPIGTDLMDYKYLVVDQKEVEIFNQNTASVSFSSSHPITLEIVSIKKWDYSTANGTELNYAPASNATDKSVVVANANPTNGSRRLLTECKVSESTDGKTIDFSHVLVNKDTDTNKDLDGNNKNADDYDYVYYTITVKVTNEYYTEYITFKQYPEMYIIASRNSDYGEPGESVSTNHADWNDNRNVFVNSYWTDGGMNGTNKSSVDNSTNFDQDEFGTVTGLNSSFNNTNPNMYVIHVTSISGGTNVIGDPREKDVNSSFIGSAKWAEAPALYVSSPRELQYYYRTDASGSVAPGNSVDASVYTTGNVIAPIFRVASSYSVASGVNTYETAAKRCASYQEDGYPAGRWRMPTFAEIRFVCNLSSEGVIPALFANSIYYWCAHGKFTPTSGGVNLSTSGSAQTIRCVYDEWYWGSGQIENKNTFTWGDQPR